MKIYSVFFSLLREHTDLRLFLIDRIVGGREKLVVPWWNSYVSTLRNVIHGHHEHLLPIRYDVPGKRGITLSVDLDYHRSPSL